MIFVKTGLNPPEYAAVVLPEIRNYTVGDCAAIGWDIRPLFRVRLSVLPDDRRAGREPPRVLTSRIHHSCQATD